MWQQRTSAWLYSPGVESSPSEGMLCHPEYQILEAGVCYISKLLWVSDWFVLLMYPLKKAFVAFFFFFFFQSLSLSSEAENLVFCSDLSETGALSTSWTFLR